MKIRLATSGEFPISANPDRTPDWESGRISLGAGAKLSMLPHSPKELQRLNDLDGELIGMLDEDRGEWKKGDLVLLDLSFHNLVRVGRFTVELVNPPSLMSSCA